MGDLLKCSRLSTRVEKLTKQEVKETLQEADDEILSIRNLMAKQGSKQIITSPREYQLELFERAKRQNTIAVLDTGMYMYSEKTILGMVIDLAAGSGKTLIAVLLLKYILDKELEDRAVGKPPRIAFFLVR